MFENVKAGSAHTTASQRLQLQEAILNNDPALFREILQQSPPTNDQLHLYGVLIKTERGLEPILVDQTGQRFGGTDTIIPAETPIDMLNVEYLPNEMIATIGDEVYRAPVAIEGVSLNT